MKGKKKILVQCQIMFSKYLDEKSPDQTQIEFLVSTAFLNYTSLTMYLIRFHTENC